MIITVHMTVKLTSPFYTNQPDKKHANEKHSRVIHKKENIGRSIKRCIT